MSGSFLKRAFERASQIGSQALEKAGQLGEQARESVEKVKDTVVEVVSKNPSTILVEFEDQPSVDRFRTALANLGAADFYDVQKLPALVIKITQQDKYEAVTSLIRAFSPKQTVM